MAKKATKAKTEEQVKAAADRAEAKAAKQKSAEPATAALKPGPAPKSPVKNGAYTAEDQRLFNGYFEKFIISKEAIASATNLHRALLKSAKSDGFTKADFDIAASVQTAEKEAKTRGRITRELTVAKMVGAKLGDQLDLFLEPTRVPAADQAYEQGKLDAMQNKVARPSHDPSTEQYRRFMEGYHEEQARQLKAGIKETVPTEQKVAVLPGPESAPSSGIGLTRADYQREMARAAEAHSTTLHEAQPEDPDENDESEAGDEPSMFRRRL